MKVLEHGPRLVEDDKYKVHFADNYEGRTRKLVLYRVCAFGNANECFDEFFVLAESAQGAIAQAQSGILDVDLEKVVKWTTDRKMLRIRGWGNREF